MKEPIEKRKRYHVVPLIITVFATLLALVSTLGCAYLYIKFQASAKVAEEALDKDEEVLLEGKDSFTADEVKTLLASEKTKSKTEFLSELKELMSNGEGAVAMLRYFYPDNIVLADKNQYYFLEISDTLQKHNYKEEDFVLTAENELEYYENGELKSHKGIDVSRYQGEINWPEVRADGVEYAYIRLGIRGYESGEIVLDESYQTNIEGAAATGMDVGVYFFTQAITVAEAEEEADFVLQNIAAYPVKCPVVYDIEALTAQNARTKDLTMEERTKICIAFCEKLKSAGYEPMIYGNLKTFMLMLDMQQLEIYQKWFACYEVPVYFPYKFRIWQYSETGKVNGIEGDVDLNITLY